MKIDVLILYEHINRELESALFLQRRLIERGYSARVAHIGWDEGVAKIKYQPQLVVTPWCYDENDIQTICNYNSSSPDGTLKLLNLHCEQITSEEAMQFLLPKGKAKDVYHIAWGNFFKKHLMSVGVEERKICVAGSSRLDFFRKECSGINKSKSELASEFFLDENKKWFLLVGNFSAVFFSEEKIRDLEKRHYSSVRRQVKIAQETYERILDWYHYVLEYCAENRTAVEFIYRPHPSELLSEKLLELDKKYHNFHIIRDYSIRDWFVNCDVAFSWNSTSAIEAAFADIPIYALRPVKIPKDQAFPILESLQQIVNVEQFLDAIKISLKGENKHINDLFRKEIDYYYSVNEHLATDLTADFVKKILADDNKANIESSFNIVTAVWKYIHYCIKVLCYKLRLMPKGEKFNILKNEYIDRERYETYVVKNQKI